MRAATAAQRAFDRDAPDCDLVTGVDVDVVKVGGVVLDDVGATRGADGAESFAAQPMHTSATATVTGTANERCAQTVR
jgi:hypothetical protein